MIGFDDQPLSELMDLSTIRQPVADQALDITTRLLALIADDEGATPGETAVVLPTELDRPRKHPATPLRSVW